MSRWSKSLAVLAVLVLDGCGPRAMGPHEANQAASSIRYIKDPKTGLCFAAIAQDTYNGYPVVSIATVPCERVP